MPTGYTASIKDGIGFEDFVLRCSRAMGALISMRDEPMDADIPDEFLPSDYHVKEAEEARASLEKFKSMTDKEVERCCDSEYHEEVERNKTSIDENNALRAKYEYMLAKVKKWEPPTPDHEGLKSFMIEQITESIKWDCNNEYCPKHPPQLLSVVEWRNSRTAKALRDIDYHTNKHLKEVGRSRERTEWVQELKKSLGVQVKGE